MLALVLVVFAAVGPCRPVQVSEGSLPCFAYAHNSLLPSSWYTVASLARGARRGLCPLLNVCRQLRFITGQPCLPVWAPFASTELLSRSLQTAP